jgi:hypothetical protein
MRRLAVLGLLLAGLAGCDLFKPATPEPPDKGGPPVPANYSAPDSVLETIRLAIEAKGGANAGDAYINAFADSTPTGTDGHFFRAFVSNDILLTFPPDRRVDWTFYKEQFFYAHLIAISNDPYKATWSPDDLHADEIGTDLTILHRKYRIETVPKGGAQPIVIAAGYADLYFYPVPTAVNEWVIGRWDDRVDPEEDPLHQTYGQRRLGS